MTISVNISNVQVPEDVCGVICSQIENPKDLCQLGQVSHFFQDLANRNCFWEPFQKALVKKLFSDRRKVYAHQEDKKESFRLITMQCPISGDELLKKIETFFKLLKKEATNLLSCTFSDGVEISISIFPKKKKGFFLKKEEVKNEQNATCDCRVDFFKLSFKKKLCAPSVPIIGLNKEQIQTKGGSASCMVFVPERLWTRDNLNFCDRIHKGILGMIQKKLE